jgi:flavin reductase (DIM6/NTAB) family NADH-FMN oxidoreductase RutF
VKPGKTVEIDLATLDQASIYRLMIDCIVPRPIALVSTRSKSGVGNLAPFSFFNGVGSNPPTLVFSVSRKRDGTKKDTLLNIEATRQFVVNVTSEWMAEPMHQSSASYPYGVDEMEKVGLTPLPSVRVAPPRVAESAVQMECELHSTVQVGGEEAGASTLVIGRILLVHVAEAAYQGGRVRIEKLLPISRLGGDGYARVSGVFEIPRAKVPGTP